MNVVTRDEWGARDTSLNYQSTPAEAWLHHTVGDDGGDPHAYMRAMQRFHMDSRGWRDIAYNFVGDADTRLWFEGRGGLAVPGAQRSHNVGTVAVCLMGDYRTKPIDGGVLEWVAEFMVWLHGQGFGPRLLTGGHRDAPGQITTCPGRLGDRIGEINTMIEEFDVPTVDEIADAVAGRFGLRSETDHTGREYTTSDVVRDAVWRAEVGRGDRRELLSQVLVEARNYARADFVNGDGDPETLAAAVADAVEAAGIADAVAGELSRRLANT